MVRRESHPAHSLVNLGPVYMVSGTRDRSTSRDNFTESLYDKKLSRLTEIKLTLILTLIFMTSMRPFPLDFFVDLITVASFCLNFSSSVYILSI